MNIMSETEKVLRNNVTADEWAWLAYAQTGNKEEKKNDSKRKRSSKKA